MQHYDLISQIQMKKSGPAFTIHVSDEYETIMTVDFVPVLEFQYNLPGYKKVPFVTVNTFLLYFHCSNFSNFF